LHQQNDNAYKHELPPKFRVSPSFNISDLKPYLGEEDDLESRTTPIQEGEDDEDITLLDAQDDPLVDTVFGHVSLAARLELMRCRSAGRGVVISLQKSCR